MRSCFKALLMRTSTVLTLILRENTVLSLEEAILLENRWQS